MPRDDAYGRVTDSDRYQVLVKTAQDVIETLAAAYQIDVQRGGAELDPELCEGLPVDRVVRLEPARDDAAPLTIVLSSFPGVAIRAGRWHTAFFPSCGCDACDEQPDDLVADLARQLHAVAAGRLLEELRGGIDPHLTISLSDDQGGWGTQTGTISRRELKHKGGPISLDWQPWPSHPR
ncbi:MAG: DUF6226 family protein [Intrasporangiaceae bacterium]|nr:DUF6226 family protein [Intrasporangiaceae bacterium]